MKLIRIGLMLSVLVACSSAHSTTTSVTWLEGKYTKGRLFSGSMFFTDAYIDNFTPFYADQLVGISGNGYMDRLSYDGVPEGDMTYSLSILLDNEWTSLWSFFSPDGSGNFGISLSETQPDDCWWCQTPTEAGYASMENINFSYGLVSGIRLSVDSDFTWAFHKVGGDVFTFANTTTVPLPGAFWLFISGIVAVVAGRKI